ncbi:unnamed protein product [Acanthoscelides obtectus]|uniref:Uncharacterized protein n=1 Tax=Acanthoscelides obtectus TaxID=200917 RepID=A0A9P0QJN6_ACAOB|nr:unnamed protein product [Acanthoscelides obtectus]CAK1686646.1 hypothetical protein AOBTE_LOCUS36013 [Acanthoscelides obtectus]
MLSFRSREFWLFVR